MSDVTLDQAAIIDSNRWAVSDVVWNRKNNIAGGHLVEQGIVTVTMSTKTWRHLLECEQKVKELERKHEALRSVMSKEQISLWEVKNDDSKKSENDET